MKWLNENRWLWPTAKFLLLIAALLGTWAYEQIHVPAEFTCSPPNIRLKGDFCGTPASGVMITMMAASMFQGLPGALLHGEEWRLSDSIREIVMAAILFSIALPLLTIPARVVWNHSRVWRASDIAAWGLGLLAAGFIALAGFAGGGWRPIQAWGAWLYFGLAMTVLIVEIAPTVGRHKIR